MAGYFANGDCYRCLRTNLSPISPTAQTVVGRTKRTGMSLLLSLRSHHCRSRGMLARTLALEGPERFSDQACFGVSLRTPQ
jgi:hypothetical protein